MATPRRGIPCSRSPTDHRRRAASRSHGARARGRRPLGSCRSRHRRRGPARDPRVLALDIRPPALAPGGKVEFVKVDLTQPTVDGELATLLERHRVDTFVHGAFLSHPTHASEWAHELEDVGTMHVLNACAGVEPRRLVMISTTLVYGAHAKNPNFLTEGSELRGHRDSRFVNDKVAAEKQIQR